MASNADGTIFVRLLNVSAQSMLKSLSSSTVLAIWFPLIAIAWV